MAGFDGVVFEGLLDIRIGSKSDYEMKFRLWKNRHAPVQITREEP
jgi:hypothetical protein